MSSTAHTRWALAACVALAAASGLPDIARAFDFGNPIFQESLQYQLRRWPGGFQSLEAALAHMGPRPKACRRAGVDCVRAVVVQFYSRPGGVWYAAWTPRALSYCYSPGPDSRSVGCDTPGAVRGPKLNVPPHEVVPAPSQPAG
jgi:hypothetical protein